MKLKCDLHGMKVIAKFIFTIQQAMRIIIKKSPRRAII